MIQLVHHVAHNIEMKFNMLILTLIVQNFYIYL